MGSKKGLNGTSGGEQKQERASGGVGGKARW